MRRTISIFGIALLVSTFLGFLLTHTPPSHAKFLNYSNWNLGGTWAVQWMGTVVVPSGSPLAVLNGPYCLTGWVHADGMGNAQGNVYDNYNGMLLHYTWQGTYQVNEDGTLTLTATLPLLGNPYTIQVFGVICDDGKMVRITQIGPTTTTGSPIPGVPLVASVATGSWIRQ